jgi:hypothetical protein
MGFNDREAQADHWGLHQGNDMMAFLDQAQMHK